MAALLWVGVTLEKLFAVLGLLLDKHELSEGQIGVSTRFLD
jgi:hypothetical protein